MNTQQIKQLERKSKMGWACYYQSQQKHHEETSLMYNKIMRLQIFIRERDKPLVEKAHIPEFITNEILELTEQLKREIQCPICMDDLPAKEIKFSSCGHKYCKDCLSKIDKCALCKSKIYKKK